MPVSVFIQQKQAAALRQDEADFISDFINVEKFLTSSNGNIHKLLSGGGLSSWKHLPVNQIGSKHKDSTHKQGFVFGTVNLVCLTHPQRCWTCA